jgi:hypothetical protein
MKKWNVNKKPPEDICPEEYCFFWCGDENKCRETFGVCRRSGPNSSNNDWYEPCEPELEKQGLPWFYFIPCSDKLVDELREEYNRESKKLWKVD